VDKKVAVQTEYSNKVMKLKALMILAGIAPILFLGCGTEAETVAGLKTSIVERGDMTQTVVATGRVRPLHQIEIRSKSGGTVRKFYVEEGDRVNKGDRLFEITPDASPTEQVRAKESLRKTNLEVTQAEDDLKIAEELWSKKLVPEQEVRDARRALDRAQAGLAAAEAEWGLIQRESLSADAEQSGAMDIVRSSTTIVAPIDGLIFTREADEGATVTPTTSASGGTVVITMGDDSELEFRGDVDEADIGKLKVGLPINLTVQAYAQKQFNGEITHISPVGRYDQEEQQTVFGVRARLANEEKLLRVGLSATSRIVVDERKDVAIIDEMGLNFRGDTVFVKLIKDSIKQGLEERVITLGISDGIRTEVTSGLAGGEVISLGSVADKGD
jgi:HlyD family secretion protein